MVSAVTGEPGRAAEANRLRRGAVERPVEASARPAVHGKAAEAQPSAAPVAPPAVQEAVATTGAASADRPQVASRIAETVHSAVMRGDSEVRLVLNPPELGRVDIRIVDTADGLVVAMKAANGEARELISRSLVALQVALEGRELRVDRLTVDQPSQQSQDEPGWQGQRGQDGRQRGRDEESNGNGFGARDEEAHDASSGTPPGRRVDAPAGVRHDGALNLVA
jgi:flagellar hook-length control protein FliK